MEKNELVKVEGVKELDNGDLKLSNPATFLGHGGCMVRFDPNDGAIVSSFKKIKLTEEEGHFYYEKWSKKHQLTAEAFRKLNSFINFIDCSPNKIIIGNEEKDNPYMIFNERTGKVKLIIEDVALGAYGPDGKFSISKARIIHDNEAEFAAKLLKHMQQDSSIGTMMNDKMFMKKFEAGENVYFIPQEQEELMPGQFITMGICLFLDEPKAWNLYMEYKNSTQFDIRKVHTKAWRNAAKSHPAISKTIVNPQNGVAYVNVVMWHTHLTDEENQMIENYKQYGQTEKPDVEFYGYEVEDPTEKDPDEIETEQEYETVESESETVTVEEVEIESSEEDRKMSLIKHIKEAYNILPEEVMQAFILQAGGQQIEEMSIGQLEMIKLNVNKAVDQGGNEND